MTKAKFKSFGKVRTGGKSKVDKEIAKLVDKKHVIMSDHRHNGNIIREIDEKIRHKRREEQSAKFSNELKSLIEIHKRKIHGRV